MPWWIEITLVPCRSDMGYGVGRRGCDNVFLSVLETEKPIQAGGGLGITDRVRIADGEHDVRYRIAE